jgi:PAS domain S-box-containing protein
MRRHYGRQWLRRMPTTYAEFRVCTDRGEVWIGQNVQLILEGDEPVGFQAVARDITDRKLAQSALARLQQQTESILNSAAEGILSVDNRGVIVMVNAAAAQLTGYGVSDMQGQEAHGLLHHAHDHGSSAAAGGCGIQAAVHGGQPQRSQTDVFWRRDGTSFPVEYSIVPVRDGSQVSGAVLTFHDISERQAIERMKDDFISVVSHELRTPLTSIRGSLGLLAGGLLDLRSDQARRMIDLAVSNSDRLIRLINDILDVERMASGHVVMDLEAVDVRGIVQRSIESVQALAESASIRLDGQAEAGEIQADPDRLMQALTNLIGNAIKFSPEGSTVLVQARGQAAEVVFSVTDHGRGIPPEKIEGIFNRFEQVDASDSREKGGTGLGLAISRNIVELHGGRMWVESRVGEGSCFSFTIPRDG